MSAVLQPELPAFEIDAPIRIGVRTVAAIIEVYGEFERGWSVAPRGDRNFYIRRLECLGADVTDWLSDNEMAEVIYNEIYRR